LKQQRRDRERVYLRKREGMKEEGEREGEFLKRERERKRGKKTTTFRVEASLYIIEFVELRWRMNVWFVFCIKISRTDTEGGTLPATRTASVVCAVVVSRSSFSLLPPSISLLIFIFFSYHLFEFR